MTMSGDLPRGVVPRGTYAKGGRSPVVYVMLCAPCAGYAPPADGDYGSDYYHCQGCGAWTLEVHRFQALIMSAANGGCMCTTEHPQVTGDLPTEDSLGAVWTELATRPMSPLGRSERDEAVGLLEEALHLRMNGERAPGGNETWRDWDLRAEQFMQERLARLHPETSEPPPDH
jgi:hypothetical protein